MGLFLIPLQDWEAAGHSIRTAWVELVGRFGASAVLALLVAFVVVAFLRRHRYRAVDVLTADDLAQLHAELVAAEKRTVGEILPVVVERSDPHPGARFVAALFTFLVGSTLLAGWLPWDRPELLVPCQLLLGAAGYGLARLLPDFQRRFVREARATAVAEEQAFQEFFRHALHETEARTGVLLFVSLFERRVVVLADEGIDAKVGAECWEATDRAILEGLRAGSLRDGLKEGIRQVAEVLEEHFPWTEGDRNEVPDRIVVRSE